MDNKPTVSICIPTYKRPRYLRRALESIVHQNGFDQQVEVLVRDDASPEQETAAIMAEFSARYPNIRCWRTEKNGGEGANEVFLIEHAEGAYVFFLTDDDWLLPDALTELKKIIAEHSDCTFLASTLEIHGERDGHISLLQSFDDSRVIPKEDVKSIAKLFDDFHTSSRMCWRRDAIDIEGHRRHIKSLYQHLYTIGSTALKGKTFYYAKPLVAHTNQNEMFWEYSDDYMFEGILKIIKDLSKINPKFYQPAFAILADELGQNAAHSLSRGPKYFFRFIKKMLGTKETRFNGTIWVDIMKKSGSLMGRVIKKRIKKALKKTWSPPQNEELFVSDKYRCIFIRMPKTASTSMLPQFPDMHGAYSPPTELIKKRAREKWGRYYKFVFIRNTWDRVLSIYLYLDRRMRDHAAGVDILKRQPKEWLDTDGDINKFLKHFYDKYGPAWIEDMHEIFYSQMRWIKDPETGKDFGIDFIGRYENLQDDFDRICDKIGKERVILPHENRTEHRHYREHYNEESRRIVAEIYKEEIERFGFKF